MKSEKKIIILIVALIVVIGLIRGSLKIESNVSDTAKDGKDKVQIPEEDLEEYINEDPNYVEYFDNIDDALQKSRLTYYRGANNILKTFEIGSNFVLFTIGDGEENEEFSRYRLKVMDFGKSKEYSQPLDGVSTDYANIKSPSDKIGKMMSGDEETRLWRNFEWHNQEDPVDPISIIKEKYKNFKWSVTDIENVKYLEIKGQKPDEIIPFTLDGNDLYFYYYLDLDLDEGYDRKDFKIKK